MREFLNEEMDEYINSDDPLDKAGAYAIQHSGFHPAEDFHGCMANVMGLPLCHLKRGMRELGLDLDTNVRSICQRHLHYDCSITSRVLSGEDIG